MEKKITKGTIFYIITVLDEAFKSYTNAKSEEEKERYGTFYLGLSSMASAICSDFGYFNLVNNKHSFIEKEF